MHRFGRAARLAMASAVLMISAMVGILTLSGPASATEVLTVTPNSGLSNGQTVSVSGTGFTGGTGAIVECNDDTATQPTVTALGNQIPVSCTVPTNHIASTSGGNLPATPFAVVEGIPGPPASGTDSAGHPAATDAANYPCPPTTAQIAIGDSCTIAFATGTTDRGTSNISFGGVVATTTTTGVNATTTTTGVNATTTTAVNSTTTTAVNSTTTTTAAPTGPNLAASPNTGLSGGTSVTVTGSNFDPTSTGALLECNDAANQPTISALGNDIPVSCSVPTNSLVTTTASGDIPAGTTFSIIQGTVGPPGTGTDSNGNSAATDAALYPCPPTAAQIAAGDTCQLNFGDEGGATAATNITFVGETPVPTTTTTKAAVLASSQTSGTSTGTTKTVLANGTLAFTGAGPGVWVLAIGGMLLLDLGFLVMTMYYRPRELLLVAGRRVSRIFGAE